MGLPQTREEGTRRRHACVGALRVLFLLIQLPHLNSEKLKRLYEKYQPAVDAHVLDLLNQAAVSITLPIDENFFHRDQKISWEISVPLSEFVW